MHIIYRFIKYRLKTIFWHGYCYLLSMTLAITPWNQRVAPVFDSSEHILILDAEPDRQAEGQEFDYSNKSPTDKALFLVDQGVEQLICGAISRDLELLIRDRGIDVYSFIAGNVDEVIDAWITGQLDKPIYAMPGCLAGRRHRWGRQGDSAGYGRGLEGGYYAKR